MIIFEDKNWLAVNKPTGVATHAANSGQTGMAEWLELHLGKSSYICSRLDKGTSGVLLFAKTKTASGKAQQIHELQSSKKTYYFLSNKQYRGKQDKSNWHVATPLDGKECSTTFRLVESGHGVYCYEATIVRGRTHQIRRHAALSGTPILGDDIYGGKPFSRLCLHCATVLWPEIEGDISTPIPDSFSFLLDGRKKLAIDAAIAWERRQGWPSQVSNCFRLIHRGELELPVSIDIYGSYLSITGFSNDSSKQLQKKLQPVLDYLITKLSFRGSLLRQHVQNPHKKKLIHDVITWGEPIPDQLLVKEHNLAYQVNINDSQHVGLFLDQRDSRRYINTIAKDKRVANLFSFSCSFSAAALDGGAEVVFSVDLAGSALTRGKENFSINGLAESGKGKFIQEDVCKWLNRQERKQQADPENFNYWDIVICDPPVFASAGKGRGFHVEKEWPELARQIRLLLSEDGVALFANNHRSGNPAFYFKELKKHFRTVIQRTPPLDFPILENQPEHVRIYLCKP